MTLLRHEDQRLITGAGKFSADWNYEGQCHMAVLRSPYAHAHVLKVKTEQARQAEGVLLVLTAADVTAARYNAVPSGPEIKGIDGTSIKKGTMPVLAIDRVRYVGQAVAVVIADTALRAQDACELIDVDYRELPAVADARHATDSGAVQLHHSVESNRSLHFESGDREAVEAAFQTAAKTAAVTLRSQRLYGAPLEPKAILAHYDHASGKTRVHTPTQGVLGMRAALSTITGLPQDTLEIVSEDVGGSFGLRGNAGSEHALAILASRTLGRPVKWVASRSELFTAEWHGRALVLEAEIALDENNHITAMRYNDTVDLGAYNCYFGGFIGTNNLSVTMGGAYRVPALYMQSQLVFTNTAPVSAYRGAGRPDIAFAVERLIDHVAAQHSLDAVEFRRQNFIAKDAFPYTTANGTVYDCGDFHAVLQKALALSDYANFGERREKARQDGKVRGIGIGYYLEKSGAGGAPKDQVSCQFNADGTLILHAMSGPSGQGHETAFARIVGDGLGIDPQQIRYRPGSQSDRLIGNGTGGSRSLYGTGSAFKNLVDEVIRIATPLAAGALKASADEISFAEGRFTGRSTSNGITLSDLAQSLAQQHGENHPFNVTAETVTGANYPNGCHIAEIEIDLDTGETGLVSYHAVDDLGNVISPVLVAGQVHGGVVQGAGQAFCEAMQYDENGQLLTGSFMDYALPRAGVLPEIETDTYAVPTGLNELGSKGVGESGCSGSLPAIANAMASALRSLGCGDLDMPYTPARVWKHLQSAQQQSTGTAQRG
jgi:carbon-monoxide dehydrogenase large subunit